MKFYQLSECHQNQFSYVLNVMERFRDTRHADINEHEFIRIKLMFSECKMSQLLNKQLAIRPHNISRMYFILLCCPWCGSSLMKFIFQGVLNFFSCMKYLFMR